LEQTWWTLYELTSLQPIWRVKKVFSLNPKQPVPTRVRVRVHFLCGGRLLVTTVLCFGGHIRGHVLLLSGCLPFARHLCHFLSRVVYSICNLSILPSVALVRAGVMVDEV